MKLFILLIAASSAGLQKMNGPKHYPLPREEIHDVITDANYYHLCVPSSRLRKSAPSWN